MGLRLMKTPKISLMRSIRYYMVWGCLQVRSPSLVHTNSSICLKLGMCRFFPREMREEKVTEFINLLQGGKSDREYTLEFIKFSKYSPSLVSDPRDQMSRFVTGVSKDLQRECQSTIIHDNMNISCFMVYANDLRRQGLSEKV